MDARAIFPWCRSEGGHSRIGWCSPSSAPSGHRLHGFLSVQSVLADSCRRCPRHGFLVRPRHHLSGVRNECDQGRNGRSGTVRMGPRPSARQACRTTASRASGRRSTHLLNTNLTLKTSRPTETISAARRPRVGGDRRRRDSPPRERLSQPRGRPDRRIGRGRQRRHR